MLKSVKQLITDLKNSFILKSVADQGWKMYREPPKYSLHIQ